MAGGWQLSYAADFARWPDHNTPRGSWLSYLPYHPGQPYRYFTGRTWIPLVPRGSFLSQPADHNMAGGPWLSDQSGIADRRQPRGSWLSSVSWRAWSRTGQP